MSSRDTLLDMSLLIDYIEIQYRLHIEQSKVFYSEANHKMMMEKVKDAIQTIMDSDLEDDDKFVCLTDLFAIVEDNRQKLKEFLGD